MEGKINNGIKKFDENDVSEIYSFIDKILSKPADDELKYLNIKNIPSRWDTIYSKIIKIDKEQNDELIYYNLTNDLLQNIKNNRTPYETLHFLKEFKKIYNKFSCKSDLQNITKKFVLIGLCNCEYIEHKNPSSFLKVFNYISDIKDLQMSDNYINNQILNPNDIYEGRLHKSILKFSKSKLAKSSFKQIFEMKNIPLEFEKEIFSENIEKYIYYFPYSSHYDTERTLKRFSLILINCNKNKKILNVVNPVLDDLLEEFTNIVVRKFTFGHEHQHLSGALLFFSEKINRVGTPPYEINEGNLIYDYNSKGKGERGELFELICYGKIFKVFNIFDLLFISNEKYDDLDIDSHLKEYKNYCEKKKDLMNELKHFPEDQTLSELVKAIYEELSKDNKNNNNNYQMLSTKAIT